MYKNGTAPDSKVPFITAINFESRDFRHGNLQDYIAQKVSTYGSTKPVELYAEIGTKMIANSLDSKTIMPVNNPFVFRQFTQDKFLMTMMDDFNKGDFNKYLQG
jgi:hypothetical protein